MTLVGVTPAVVARIVVSANLSIELSERLIPWETTIRSGALALTATLAPHALPVAAAVSTVVSEVVNSLPHGESIDGPGFRLDVNLGGNGLVTGYHVFLDPSVRPRRQQPLSVSNRQVLINGNAINEASYFALEVRAFPVQGRDAAHREAWYKLLRWAEDDATGAAREKNSRARSHAQDRFRDTLRGVARLMEDDLSFLPSERISIIQESWTRVSPQLSVERQVREAAVSAPLGALPLRPSELPQIPSKAKELLGVESNTQLLREVKAYRQALGEIPPDLAQSDG
ncbi:MAG: hypothetical protein M3P26_15450 [Gemmatimonadota bacterium]|nr:hypothetical protein [Gemmatimonadota bacterium]